MSVILLFRRYRFHNNNGKDNDNDNDKDSDTVKARFKALGLYNFIRGLRWAYKRGEEGGGLYPGGLISGIKIMFRNDEIKFI